MVTRGSIILEIDEKAHTLNEGDSIYFDAEAPHCVRNTGEDEARVICVFLGQTAEGWTGKSGSSCAFSL